jgi:glycosyltransferase involved in cell wall biosynthesis
MKTRIIFATCVYESGGTEKHLEDLIVRLDFSKVEPVILCFGRDVYTDRLNRKYGIQVEIRVVQKRNTFLAYWLSFMKARPNVVVFVNGNLGWFPWFAYVAAKSSTARRVFAIEHLIADDFLPRKPSNGLLSPLRSLAGWHARRLWKYRAEAMLCDRIICVSQAVNNKVVEHYHFAENKMVTIRNGVDLNHYGFHKNQNHITDRTIPANSHSPVVLCVARLSEPKGLDILLDAMQKILSELPECKCIIVGDGPSREKLLKKTQDLGISDSVQFTGHVDEVRPYYESSDMFVLSSLREGLPFVLLEAMTYELPCIATDVGGCAEVIVNGETGFIVRPRQPDDLARAVVKLWANPELRRKMGIKGKERVQKYFDINNTMARISEILLQ